MSPSPWDDLSFSLKGKVTYSAIGRANWLAVSLHNISTVIYIPAAEEISAALDRDYNIDILGIFTTYDSDVDAVCFRNTIYLHASNMEMFLDKDI